MKKNINNVLAVLVIVLSLIVIAMGVYIVVNKDSGKKNNNLENYYVKIDNYSVEKDALNNVLDIIGIPYINNAGNACLNNAISKDNYSENAKEIISRYIDSHKRITLSHPGDDPKCLESEECSRGMTAADYYSISKDNAKYLFETYNFNGKISDYFSSNPISDEDYIFMYAHTLGVCRDIEISHDLVSEYTSKIRKNDYGTTIGADIRLTDYQNVKKYNDKYVEGVGTTFEKISEEQRKVTYDFKTLNNGNYYLYSVEVE